MPPPLVIPPAPYPKNQCSLTELDLYKDSMFVPQARLSICSAHWSTSDGSEGQRVGCQVGLTHDLLLWSVLVDIDISFIPGQ